MSHTDARPEYKPTTKWVGWIAFAGIMMAILGMLHAFEGFLALFDQGYYEVSSSGLLINVDYTAWGVVHLLLGILTMVTGAGLLAGLGWARVVAVGLVFLSILVHVGFMAAMPTWAAVMIAIDLLVIWAIIVHGDEMQHVG